MLDILKKIYTKPRLIILDLILLNLSLMVSFYFRFSAEWAAYWDYIYLLPLIIIGIIVLYNSDLYNKIWSYASIQELKSIIKVSVIINTLLIVSFFFLGYAVPRSTLILNGILTIFALGGMRFFLRFVRDYYIKRNQDRLSEEEQTRVLIVGAGDAGEMIVREMNKHPGMGKKVVGLIDDNPAKQNLEMHGKKVLGNRYDIPKVIEKNDIDEVIIAIPSAKGDDIKAIYELSRKKEVQVKTVPGIFEILRGDVNISQIREVQVEDLLRREPVELNTDSISAYVEGKTVLVTGGGGSIGSELARQLAHFNPQKLVLLDIYENNLYFLELELRNKYEEIDIVPVIASIRDKKKLQKVFADQKPEVVFHAAAHKHVPLMEANPEEALKNNVFGTKNLAETAHKSGVERFVSISTDKAVNPTNVMGASKRISEMIIQYFNYKSDTRFMAVRFGNVLGSHGSVIPLFKKKIANREPLTVTHQDMERYFMTIPEAAQLVIQAGGLGQGGEVFVLDMGEPVKIMDLARDLIKLSGLEPNVDIDIEISGLRPGEKLSEELTHDTEDSMQTEHEKIYIKNLEICRKEELEEMLDKLRAKIDAGDEKEIIKTLVNYLDTYQPNREGFNEKKSVNPEKQKKTQKGTSVSGG